MRFIWPGIIAVVVGALFFGLHIRLYNQGAEIARRNPATQVAGEIDLLILPIIQATEELEQEIADNSEQIKQFYVSFKAQNNKFKAKTSSFKQTVNE